MISTTATHGTTATADEDDVVFRQVDERGVMRGESLVETADVPRTTLQSPVNTLADVGEV